jgi:2,5-diketo-D-gluconate reductase B
MRITDADECRETIARAVEVGYRHVDTAQKYGNEQEVGDAIAAADIDRDDLFLGTKIAEDNLAYDDVLSTAEESLARLGVDQVDLLYVHWPHPTYDAAGTLSAFNQLYDEGVMRHVGLCNFTPALLDEALELLDAPLFAHQVEMHPLLQQEELHDYAVEHDCYLVAYAPLLRGDIVDVPELQEIAAKHDATPAQVGLAWLMSKENVVPIPKGTGDHVEENFRARELTLDDEDVARIDSIDEERRVVDPPEKGPWNW